jgi:hypothetical protein
MTPDSGISTAHPDQSVVQRISLVAFVPLLLTFLVLLPLAPRQPVSGLDPSWTYAVNEAVARHLVFGRDLIFTFGPFGSVYTQFYHPATDALMLAGSALLAMGLCIGFALLTVPRRPQLLWFLPLAVAVAHSPDATFMTLPFLLLLNIYRFAEQPQLLATRSRQFLLILLAGSIGILPLVKGSFSGVVASLGVLSVIILMMCRRKYLAIALVVTTLTTMCAAWMSVGQPLFALPQFFIAQAPIISGYAEAMSLHGPVDALLWWMLSAFTCIFTFCVVDARRRGLAGIIAALGMALHIFITFKAGFVRADGHAPVAVGTLLFIALAMSVTLRAPIALCLAAIVLVGWYGTERSNENIDLRSVARFVTNSYDRAISGVEIRLNNGVLEENFRKANEEIRKEYPLGKINGSVDIYPTELSPIFAYDMKWSGRPVPQSYSAYTPGLDQIDAQHLLSKAAPDNIFFTIGPIDARLASLEDSGSWPIFLINYQIVGREYGLIHLVKAASDEPRISRLADVDGALNSAIAVPEALGPVTASIEIRKTLLGSAALAAFKLPQLFIELTLNTGEVVRNRYIVPMGQSGFVVSPYVGSDEDFVRLAAGDLSTKRVSSIRIIAPEIGIWKKAIRVSFSTFKPAFQPMAFDMLVTKSSVPLTPLADSKLAPTAQCSLDFASGVHVASHQGDYVSRAGSFHISGWAAPSASNGIGPDEIWVALTAIDRSQRFYKAPIIARPDVSAAFGRPNMKNAGFDTTIDTSGLSGHQELSVYAVSGSTAQECPGRIGIAMN